MVDKTSQESGFITPLNIVEPSGDAGPRPGLGGWGMAGVGAVGGSKAQIAPIMGYCLEKITSQFSTLRDLSQEGQDLMHSIQLNAMARPGTSAKRGSNRKRKASLEALNAAKALSGDAQGKALLAFTLDEEQLKPLEAAEKAELLSLAITLQPATNLEYQPILLNVLRNTSGPREFNKLLQSAGGHEALGEHLSGSNYGIYQAQLERFGAIAWHPPFHHALFDTDGQEAADEEEALSTLKAEVNEDAKPLIREEYLQRFMLGDITAYEMMGFTREELYAIAQRGYALLQEGKLDQALQVFEGLVYLDPYDPYFYTVLGSVRQKQERDDSAIACYEQALKLQPWNISALANRGEILFNRGQMTEALQDFMLVLEYDQEGENPSTMRVRGLLMAIREAMEKKGMTFDAPTETPDQQV